MPVIDLRSDTVTKPTVAMHAAMMAAEVGDDVYGEDPTINALEAATAAMLGKEAALFVPSGCMANQIAVRLHCRPGEELLCERTSHVLLWEGGAPAALSGVTCRPFEGDYGLLKLAQLREQINPTDVHSTQTKLLWLENTHNRGGGRIQSYDSVVELTTWAKQHGLGTHLDGARLWNAAVATKIAPKTWAKHFDTISVCFSKGLGAPVGSALASTAANIQLARRYRKLFGGAMRQVGFLAAACLHALEHHIDRLADDHANAKLLGEAIRSISGFTLDPGDVQTNVVWFRVDPSLGTPASIAAKCKVAGVLVAPLGHDMIRLVTHLDVSRADCERAAAVLVEAAKTKPA